MIHRERPWREGSADRRSALSQPGFGQIGSNVRAVDHTALHSFSLRVPTDAIALDK